MRPLPPLADAHRHLGVLPAFPFYDGPPVNPDTKARATVDQLLADLDAEGTERALVIPNYGVPDPAVSFGFNELVVEATTKSDRISAALWVSPLERDADPTAKALGPQGVTYFLGRIDGDLHQLGRVPDGPVGPACSHRPAERREDVVVGGWKAKS